MFEFLEEGKERRKLIQELNIQRFIGAREFNQEEHVHVRKVIQLRSVAFARLPILISGRLRSMYAKKRGKPLSPIPETGTGQ